MSTPPQLSGPVEDQDLWVPRVKQAFYTSCSWGGQVLHWAWMPMVLTLGLSAVVWEPKATLNDFVIAPEAMPQ